MPDVPSTDVAILVGGASRRMADLGPKALLPLGGRTLLERTVRTADGVGSNTLLVTAHDSVPRDEAIETLLHKLQLPVARDRHPDSGPLAGLDAALATSIADRVLLLACDLPFLTTPFLTWLVQQAASQAGAVPVDVDGRWHPLCGVYDRRCVDHLQHCLTAGRLRLQEFAREVGCVGLPASTWTRFDPQQQLLTNVNQVEDYERVLQSVGQGMDRLDR